MKKFLASLSLLLASAVSAQVTPVIPSGSVMGNMSGASRAPKPLSRTDYYIKDYGAVCDGSLHLLSSLYGSLGAAQVDYPSATSLTQDTDTVAINAAITAAKTSTYGARVVFPSGKVCYVGPGAGTGQGINLTAWSTKAVLIDGGGASIISQTNGKATIDMLNTSYMRVRDLYILGSATNTPSTCIQMGIGTSGSAAENTLENVFCDGFYTVTAIYNGNSETSLFKGVRAWNFQATAASYGLIQDGIWHFGITSEFLTVSRTANSPVSFNDNSFINCDFRQLGTGAPIWMAHTFRHRFYSSYALNTGSTYGMLLYSFSGSDTISFLDMDLHFETTNLTDVFLVTGSNATPTFRSLKFRDHSPQSSNSIFKLDAGVTSATATDIDLRIGGFQSGSVHVFDTASAWTVNGNVYVNSGVGTAWNANPVGWAGYLNQSGTVQFNAATINAVGPTTAASGDGSGVTINGQNAGITNQNGGSITLQPGNLAGSGGNGKVLVQPQGTTGNTSFAINATNTSAQASIAFQSLGSQKWQVGQNTGASPNFFMFDQAGSRNFLGANSNGTLDLGAASGPGVKILSFIQSGGTKFTLGSGTGACATSSGTTGGEVAGSFLCTGTAGASTQVINLPTSTNGWSCYASDVTSGVVWGQSATATNSCTIKGAIATTSDVVAFGAIAY